MKALSFEDDKLIVDLKQLPTFEELTIRVKPFEPQSFGRRSATEEAPKPNVYLELKTNIGWLGHAD